MSRFLSKILRIRSFCVKNECEKSLSTLISQSIKTKLRPPIAIAPIAIEGPLRFTPHPKRGVYALESSLRFRFDSTFIKILVPLIPQSLYNRFLRIEDQGQGLFQRNGLKNSQMTTQVNKISVFYSFSLIFSTFFYFSTIYTNSFNRSFCP